MRWWEMSFNGCLSWNDLGCKVQKSQLKIATILRAFVISHDPKPRSNCQYRWIQEPNSTSILLPPLWFPRGLELAPATEITSPHNCITGYKRGRDSYLCLLLSIRKTKPLGSPQQTSPQISLDRLAYIPHSKLIISEEVGELKLVWAYHH